MDSQRQELQKLIEQEVYRTKEQVRNVPNLVESGWVFDFKRVLLRAEVLDSLGELFWEKCRDEYPFQIGGIEVAAIPLITAFTLKLGEKGKKANGFFIRKSRKKHGPLRMVEGEVADEKIILVDDVLNTGQSFMRQVEVIESLGKKVDAVFVILRFRDLSYYAYFHDKGIRIISLFELDDFKDSIDVKNEIAKTSEPVPTPFIPEWLFRSKNPNYYQVIPKSAPIIDDTKIYFGSDRGSFWALNQADGSVAWEYKTVFGSPRKKAFSSPVLYKDAVCFGASDGNFYALDAETGKRKWVFMEADWIRSSPCVAPNLGLIFVGLEFGLLNKRGGIVAIDASTGEKKWEYGMPRLTLSSPAYSEKNNTVVCGCNDSTAYGFNAKNGKLLWTFKTDGPIKESFAFDEKRDYVCFGSFDSYFYVLKTKTGELVFKIKTGEAIYSSPLVHDSFVYIASLDKKLYCISLETGDIVWGFATRGRIFASPAIIGDKIYIGSNDGRLYELDAVTGKNTAFFQSTERITDKIAYNRNTGAMFLPTFANEIYCLKRKN